MAIFNFLLDNSLSLLYHFIVECDTESMFNINLIFLFFFRLAGQGNRKKCCSFSLSFGYDAVFLTVANYWPRIGRLCRNVSCSLTFYVKPHHVCERVDPHSEDSSSLLILGQIPLFLSDFLINVQLMLDISVLSVIII